MMSLVKSDTFPVLGIDISTLSKPEFYNVVNDRLMDSKRESPPVFVVTVNPEIAMQTLIDTNFGKILNRSTINTADGIGISWAVKYLHGELVERITGSDSLEAICTLCARHGQSVFLYGAGPHVAEKAALVLQKRIDGLRVEGSYSPAHSNIPLEDHPFDTKYYMMCASVIFVALGSPAQEQWIDENLHKLPNCKLIIGIGGSFDFIAGTVKRAPVMMQRMGVEWLYRLYLQPSRWRRMMRLPRFAMNVLKSKSRFPGSTRLTRPVLTDLSGR